MEVILSICIPCFNRAFKVIPMIKTILTSSDSRFNIIVQDNCSTDNLVKELEDIEDKRLFIYKNSNYLPPNINIIESLSHNKAQYAMLCLDKDYLNVNYLKDYIDFLDNCKPALCCICLLNKQQNEIYNSIRNFAYKSRHPSGTTFLSNLLIKEIKSSYFANEIINKYYQIDILNAHIGIQGKCAFYKNGLLSTESKEDAIKIKSHSYNKDNFYMNPKIRIEEFSSYITDLNLILIPLTDKIIILESIFYRGLYSLTLGYKNAMKDNYILEHYGLESANISLLSQRQYIYLLSKNLINKSKGFNNKVISVILCFLGITKLLLRISNEQIFKIKWKSSN